MTAPAPAVTTRRAPRLDEVEVAATLEGGLSVVVVPKPGYLKATALLVVDYGAVDRTLPAGADAGPGERSPEGVAHFLEHKLFEDEAGDVFDRFARLGASANAYTSHHETGYYFSTGARFLECLDLLLGFVSDAWMTDEQVEKERKVIAQEIRMVEDDPDARAHRALLRALYRDHPIRDEVAGTVASIAAIDRGVLQRCHRAFYRPGRMTLVCAGDLDPAAVVARAAAHEGLRRLEPGAPPPRPRFGEPEGVVSARVEEQADVGNPRVLVGYKDAPAPPGAPALRRTLESALALELLFGRSSPFYERHYATGLLDGTFSPGYGAGRSGYACTLIGGETPDPDGLVAAIAARVDEARAQGFDPADFARLRNKAYGQFVRGFNAVDQVVSHVAQARLQGWDLFSYLDVVEAIGLDDVARRLETAFDPARRAVSVVRPRAARA